MIRWFQQFRHKLFTKLIVMVGLTLLVSLSTWVVFNTRYQKQRVMENIVAGTDRLTNTIRLGTHYAMMLNSRDDINQIIQNIGRQKGLEHIRIYNKNGEIKYSNDTGEVDRKTNIRDEACYICHRTDPPMKDLALSERIRIFESPGGHRLLGVISPIGNEPSCATDACHVHPADKTILGALDVVVSLAETDEEIFQYEKSIIGLAILIFSLTAAIIFFFMMRFVNRPMKHLIDDTKRIAKGDYGGGKRIDQDDEMGQLSDAIRLMGTEIGEQRDELNKQRDEYQMLFESVPCHITVLDRNFLILNYNREFMERFDPKPGQLCHMVYKGRDEKCADCPVEKTFHDGENHYGEESGINKDGSISHWIFRTAPIYGADGEIVAAMEMSIDITHRKVLEEQLESSERKYHLIFNNIPNPVFVLDFDSLEIIDCNDSLEPVYGFVREEILGRSFLTLFPEDEQTVYAQRLRSESVFDKVRHCHHSGREIYVNIRVSPSEYPGQKVLLVTTSDITQRLETEQQLIQASKMATLGEMATGVAHELNQPLSVIKTASSFCTKKIQKKEEIEENILQNLLGKIDSNVDRATKIITHMRQFARKSDLHLAVVQINSVLEKAFEIFSQQLKVRGIEVIWLLADELPRVRVDPDRLEQVFINLFINARDAIEQRWESAAPGSEDKRISVSTGFVDGRVEVRVRDTGTGIAPAIQDKIFEPFYTTKEVGKGTGLGLSISYGIVKECGGSIRVDSKPGDGACFILRFPPHGGGTEDEWQKNSI